MFKKFFLCIRRLSYSYIWFICLDINFILLLKVHFILSVYFIQTRGAEVSIKSSGKADFKVFPALRTESGLLTENYYKKIIIEKCCIN